MTARKNCENHFPGFSQATTRQSCTLGLVLHQEKNRDGGLAECTKQVQKISSASQACKIGVSIADEMAKSQDNFTPRLKLCQTHYPIRTEADTYLQESCLFGVYLAHENAGSPLKKPKLALCEQISKDGAFLGPCGTGLSLAAESSIPMQAASADQQRACNKYFDHTAFHQGYRACLNSRALSLEWDGKSSALAKQCRKLSSSKNGDTEAAACVIGGNLLRHVKVAPTYDNPRFKHCGDSKVRWNDRDFLVCLTAASFLDLGSLQEARNSCKEVFGGRRNRYRDDCFRAVESLNTQKIIALPQATPTPATKAEAKSEDADLWPESPDIPPEEIEMDEVPAADPSLGSETTQNGGLEDVFPAILDDQIDRGPVSEEGPTEVTSPVE